MASLAADGATSKKEHHPVKLRKWQDQATKSATGSFLKQKRKIFATEACTGAGKTRHGVETAVVLIDKKAIDLVIVITPSIATRSGWRDSFEAAQSPKLNLRVTSDKEFPIDTNVWLTTYSGYENAKKALSSAPVRLGIFTIVDEYHHAEHDAAWGDAVSELGGIAKHVLFLSGTPWKQTGYCPLLSEETNIHGARYYDEGSNRVNPDFCHDYKRDLESGEDRATHWINFTFLPSEFKFTKGPRTGDIEKFELPDYKNKTPEERLIWQEEARRDTTPLGRHVQVIDNTLKDSKLAREVIETAIKLLRKSRAEVYEACGQEDMTIMLLVCQNIQAAKDCTDYISEAYQLKTALIVSEDDRSHAKLETIREDCRTNSSGKPDVIVSVGMVSEGVDIPQIKVIAYLSAILTMLYLIQVIGRGLRRMFVSSKKRFADEFVDQITSYVVAPAHPKICYVASKIEEQMEDAQRTQGVDGGGPGPDREEVEGISETTGETETFLRGQADGAAWTEAIERLKQHERASECFLDNAWCSYVLGLALNGDAASRERAQSLTKEMCDCLDLEYKNIWTTCAAKSKQKLGYDEHQRLLRKQAIHLTNVIRWKCAPYCENTDNDVVYPQIRYDLNNLSGLGGVKFAKASQEKKQEWIAQAQQMLKRGHK